MAKYAKLWAVLGTSAVAALVAVPVNEVPTWAAAAVTGLLAAIGVWRAPANKQTDR